MAGIGQTSTRVQPLTLGSVPEVVALHRSAFAGYLNTRLGPKYLHNFYSWFCEAEEAIAICALDGERIGGFVVGAPLGYTDSLNRRVLPTAIKGMILRPYLLAEARFRRTLVAKCQSMIGIKVADDAPDLPSTTYSLVGIAVHPDNRGRRIGSLLMEAFEARANEANANSLRLSVYRENEQARNLYARCGWIHHPRDGNRADYYYKMLGNRSATKPPPVDVEGANAT